MHRTFTTNGRTYTEWFAWWPRRMASGEWVWMTFYYMRPDRNGVGILLSRDDLMRDYILPKD